MFNDTTPPAPAEPAPAAPFGFHGSLNRAERHALAERQRTAAMLANSAPDALAEIRNDPAAGLAFVLREVGPTVVVAIHPDQGTVKARSLDAGTLDRTAAWATELNAAEFNLYFTLNESAAGMAKKPAKADIVTVRGVCADVDAKNGRTLESALAAVRGWPGPAPSFIIATGGGYQPVWLLDPAVPASLDAVARAESIGRRIGNLMSGDAVQNVDRILRLPFTVNHPNAPKRTDGRVAVLSGLVRGGQPARLCTMAEIEAALPPDPVGAARCTSSTAALHGGPPPGVAAVFAGRVWPDMNAAAAAGLPGGFDALAPHEMNRLLSAVLTFAPIAKAADAPRAEWLSLLWALADAEQRGATEGRRLALEWSKQGRTFNQADFDRDWASFRPSRIGVGTLVGAARKAGFDFAPWFYPAPTPVAAAPPPGGFMQPVPFNAADLHPVPWVMPGLLVRGDLTVLAGQGGGAKTVATVNLCVALAAGRTSWGPFKVTSRADGAPMRVLIVSGEEDPGRLGLLVQAACSALGLPPAGRANVEANLMVHDARGSGWRLGEPRPREREDMAPEGEDRMRDMLRDALAAQPVDLVVLDTLAGLLALPNENDNTAVTRLLNRLARVVRDSGCAGLLVHHTPKTTREGVAAQRGEATLVRGGGAIVNSARVVWSLTGLPLAETAAFAAGGTKPGDVRRLDPVKMNDCAPPPPAFLEVVGQMVTVADKTRHSIRAVRFLPPPVPASAGGLPTTTLNIVMQAIDAGAMVGGVRVPLSPGGGWSNARDAVRHIAQRLRAANPGLAEAHAETVARQALKHLRDALGCVKVQDVPAAKQSGGKPNGKGTVKGLACRWDLAPWAGAAVGIPDGGPGNTPTADGAA